MKRLCIGVAVMAGVMGFGWLGGIDFTHEHNVATMLWTAIAVWAGYMAATTRE